MDENERIQFQSPFVNKKVEDSHAFLAENNFDQDLFT